jgi:two-component system, LytTR family, response regulator AlgR
MSALRVLLVDDEKPARERLRELLNDGRDEIATEIVGEASSGPEAIALVPECGAELALIDIQMPMMSGIELARHLQGLEQPPAVIFVTAHDQYAVQAFEVNALDYLLKPVRLPRLVEALKKAARGGAPDRERLARADPGPRRFFSVAERGKLRLLPVSEVLFLKAELKYTTLRTREQEFIIEEPLSQIEEELPDVFLRVHRNCLVARNLIRGVEQVKSTEEEARWGVLVEGHAEPIAVSRRQWAAVKAFVKA